MEKHGRCLTGVQELLGLWLQQVSAVSAAEPQGKAEKQKERQ
eukprot:SAG22_NODE_465_length_10181_cov_6.604444_14_plen_42_part_00